MCRCAKVFATAIMKLFVVFILLMLVIRDVYCEEDPDGAFEDSAYTDAMQFLNECGSKPMSLCFKEKALKYIERLPSDIELGGGLVRVKESPNNAAETEGSRSRKYSSVVLPDDRTAREEVLDRILLDRIAGYFESHFIEIKLPSDAVGDMKRSMEEEGRKKGGGGGNKGGGGGGKGGDKGNVLLILFAMKAAAVGAIALKLVALAAFKALLIAKVALTISTIIALKKLLDTKHTSTVEVVASHPHEYDFDRAFNPADIAYKGHN